MITLQLNHEYRLTSDERQWIIQKLGKRKDKKTGEVVPEWRNQTFHPAPRKAVQYYANMRVRTSDAETLTQALENIEKLTTELTNALTPYFDVSLIERDKNIHHWTE